MYFMAHVLVKIWQVATINRHSVSYNEKPFSLSPRTVCRWAFWVVGGLCATKSFRDPNQWSPRHPIGVLQICSIFYSAPSEKEHGESMAWLFMCCPGKDMLALCSNSIEGTQGPGTVHYKGILECWVTHSTYNSIYCWKGAEGFWWILRCFHYWRLWPQFPWCVMFSKLQKNFIEWSGVSTVKAENMLLWQHFLYISLVCLEVTHQWSQRGQDSDLDLSDSHLWELTSRALQCYT